MIRLLTLVTSKVLLIYDFLLMFGEEVSLIWLSPWTPIKAIYLLSRYLPFIDLVVSTYYQFAPNLTVAECETGTYVTSAMYVFGMGLSEAILTFRIWLLWGKNQKLTFGLPILFFVTWATDFLVIALSTKTFSFLALPYPFNRGCALLSGDRTAVAGWAALLFYNTVTLALVLILACCFSKLGITSHLLRRLYRDCIYYYLFLFLVSIINASVISLRGDYIILLASTLRSLHSIVSNRVILDIRREAAMPPQNGSGLELSDLVT
ncbi:hypothetical protein JOM56_004911 [Amanita muscaria]